MPYFNTTANVGLVWYVGTSTLTTTGTFTIEGQSSTNQLLIRNLWIPKGSSTDVYMAVSTGAGATVLLASGVIESYNSFHWLISASTLTITIKNNSNQATAYAADGVVLRT
mgnify:FL=1